MLKLNIETWNLPKCCFLWELLLRFSRIVCAAESWKSTISLLCNKVSKMVSCIFQDIHKQILLVNFLENYSCDSYLSPEGCDSCFDKLNKWKRSVIFLKLISVSPYNQRPHLSQVWNIIFIHILITNLQKQAHIVF